MIGLGSNQGDRAANIAAAIKALQARDVHILKKSAIYETEPVGGPPQPDYLNSAVLIVTAISAEELLERCMAVERSLGRVRPDPVRWGPRPIDLDLLWIEGEGIDTPDLVIPHPRVAERLFALRPLLDVAPDAVDFNTGLAFATLPLAKAPIRKFSDPPR